MVAVWLALVASALFAHLPDVAAAAAGSPKINGWFPCHDTMRYPRAPAPATVGPFECAEVEAPLCHEGICTSAKTINLFVKRLLAKEPTTPRKAMWFLQGGPGYASAGSTYRTFRCVCMMIVIV